MKFIVNFKGKISDNEWFDDINFESLKNVTQVCGFIFNKQDRVCLVKYRGVWSIPGGTPEKKDSSLSFKLSLLDNSIYDAEKTAQIAQLPSKDELLGKIIGSMKSPISKFVYTLKFNTNKFVYILRAKSKEVIN